MSKSLREETSRKALSRLLVDHSPPPGLRKRKRQKVDRTSGSSSSVPNVETHTHPQNGGTGKREQSNTGDQNVEATTVDHHVPEKPPVKNKVC